MKRSGSVPITSRFAPLIVIPLAALVLLPQFHGIPDFVRGLVTGAAIALLLGFCLFTGVELATAKRRAEQSRLDRLDPLGELRRNEDDQP